MVVVDIGDVQSKMVAWKCGCQNERGYLEIAGSISLINLNRSATPDQYEVQVAIAIEVDY